MSPSQRNRSVLTHPRTISGPRAPTRKFLSLLPSRRFRLRAGRTFRVVFRESSDQKWVMRAFLRTSNSLSNPAFQAYNTSPQPRLGPTQRRKALRVNDELKGESTFLLGRGRRPVGCR